MRIVPKTLLDKLQFYETKLVKFAENASAIGLTLGEVAELQARAQAARDAYDAQRIAQQAARAATSAFNNAMDALGTYGAATILRVRAKAASSGDDNVYPMAGLPMLAKGSPIGEPGKPDRLEVRLDQARGDLILNWACKNPRGSSGTLYEIHRKIVAEDGAASDGNYLRLALTAKKRYTDTMVPAGATSIVYRIQSIRSTKFGPASLFVVNFGSNGQQRIGRVELRDAA